MESKASLKAYTNEQFDLNPIIQVVSYDSIGKSIEKAQTFNGSQKKWSTEGKK
jgi:hypothetical protein